MALALGLSAVAVRADEPPAPLRIYAAGSLRAALTEAGRAFEGTQPGQRVAFTFGASGLLKDRLLQGERADVFASANMAHPQALADAGLARPPQRFTRNALCALVAPSEPATTATLVARMLDPQVKLGTSTPKADPAGDYAFELFDRIEQAGTPGANAALSAKALQLTGGPLSPPPPADRSVYAELVHGGQADIFIAYCTAAVVAVRERPALRRVDVPSGLNVSADYGATVLRGAAPAAESWMQFLLGEAGQAILARHGFSPR